MIFTEKRTFPDNNGQIRTIPDKYGHCAWARYYLCITSPQITQMNTDFFKSYPHNVIQSGTECSEGSRGHKAMKTLVDVHEILHAPSFRVLNSPHLARKDI